MTKEYYEKNKHRIREQQKEYNQRPEVKQKRKEYIRKYRKSEKMRDRERKYNTSPEVKERKKIWARNHRKG